MTDPLPEIRFYHLEDAPVASELPALAVRMMEAGGGALVRVPDYKRAGDIDKSLWSFDPLSFLPHAIASHGDDKKSGWLSCQPLLITEKSENTNHASFLVMVDGATMDDIGQFARAFYMFDSRDTAVLSKARDDWRAFKEAGFDLSYWQKSGRGWEQKA